MKYGIKLRLHYETTHYAPRGPQVQLPWQPLSNFNTLTQVNRQDRQVILRGLLLVTNSMDFDSTDVLIHATTRLRRCHLVTEDNNYVVEYDATIVSDTSSDAEEFVSNTESGTSYYPEDEVSIQTKYASLDGETIFLCKDCIDDTY